MQRMRASRSGHWQFPRTYASRQPFIATAFPGFKDIYQQARVHESCGSIDPRDGKTLTDSLNQAMQSKAAIIQIATWNDYGEGTVIEPTQNHGYRHLEALPRCTTPEYLRLPVLLYEMRKRGVDPARLDEVARLLFASKPADANELLKQLSH